MVTGVNEEPQMAINFPPFQGINAGTFIMDASAESAAGISTVSSSGRMFPPLGSGPVKSVFTCSEKEDAKKESNN